jgi:predicted esterase
VSRASRALLLLPASAAAGHATNPADGLPLTLALHGFGKDAHSFADKLALRDFARDRAWLIPDGFLPFEKRREPGIGYAWYLFAQDQMLLRATMEEACVNLQSVLHRALAEAAESGVAVNRHRISILGFSQGGYLAGVLAAWKPSVFHAAACACGRLKHEFVPAAGDCSDASKPRFLQLLGERDTSVSPELAARGVEGTRALGYDVESRSFDAGHEVTPAMLAAFAEWESR